MSPEPELPPAVSASTPEPPENEQPVVDLSPGEVMAAPEHPLAAVADAARALLGGGS